MRYLKNTPPRCPSGFALVATISVMVLLVMVALAMLSLATVESRADRNTSAQHEAQMNARLALMEAIAKLQSTAGRDQYITATADFAGAADGTRLATGAVPLNNISHDGQNKGLSGVVAGTRHWTGIWRNREASPEVSIFTKTPSAERLDWLVSGVSSIPTDGSLAVNSSGQVNDNTRAVVLVGENTVGPATGLNVDNYVTAPLVSTGSGGQTTGRYAWWIGDEGVKARNNLRADYAANAIARHQDLIANRRGWEAVSGFADYPKPGQDEALGRTITDRELELAAPSLRGVPLQSTFHASTPYSIGLVTNPLKGGFKTDLTHYLVNGFPISGTFAGAPSSDSNIIPNNIAPSIRGPKWKQIKDFYDIGQMPSGKELIVSSAQTSGKNTTIAPVICDLRVLFGAKTPLHSGTVFRIFPVAKVAVAIANPYPYPLRWDTDLEFELSSDTPAGLRPSCIWDIGHVCKFLPQHSGTPACLHNAVMKIPAGVLPPGEARAYTIGQNYKRPYNVARFEVDMVPFENADAANFEHSIMQENPYGWNIPNGSSVRLDVRESTNTTQMKAELRLGTSGTLREIKSFELDNGHFRNVTRWLTYNWGKRMKQAFPLQMYEFQLSQPGADYGAILPHSSYLGLGGSTLRTYADFNIRATHFKAPIASYNPPPYFGQSMNSFSLLPNIAPGGNTGTAFTKNLAASPLPWGHSPFGPEKSITFTFPEKLLSLGQLQHADLTADDAAVSVAHQPGNAFGNSYASSFLKRHLTKQTRQDYKMYSTVRAQASSHSYYDVSYLLNAAIWDNYFLSTLSSASNHEPENPNLVPIFKTSDADMQDPEKAASQFGINGAFNINSTNVDAWVALLSSSRHLRHPADANNPAGSGGGFFPRSLEQTASSSNPPNSDEEDSWAGYRRLTDAEIKTLADHIVRQVRIRGPFTSLAHFVNRTLLPLTTKKELSRSGALQSAIDDAGLTVSPERDKTAFTGLNLAEDRVYFQHIGNYPRGDIDGGRPTTLPNTASDPVWAPRSADLHPGAVASILAERQILTNPQYEKEQGSRSTGIPGWLTQADILQAVGPSIAVRSDTFRIRAYGESVDVNTGKVKARAWCEAVVQRTPQYVDSRNTPEQTGLDLNDTNSKFGRRFIITSFRWLSSNEI